MAWSVWHVVVQKRKTALAHDMRQWAWLDKHCVPALQWRHQLGSSTIAVIRHDVNSTPVNIDVTHKVAAAERGSHNPDAAHDNLLRKTKNAIDGWQSKLSKCAERTAGPRVGDNP